MREPRNRDNGASDVWALTAYMIDSFRFNFEESIDFQ